MHLIGGKQFIHEDFLLGSVTARRLYHEYAKGMPIFDHHCHLPVREVAENRRFENLSRIWLAGDHYKWRALRTLGVPERLSTGELGSDTARGIWERCNELLAAEAFRARSLLQHFNVRVVCTTDDPADDLEHHRVLAGAWRRKEFAVRVLPTFRPDKALAVEVPETFNGWVDRLAVAADTEIRNYRRFLEALQSRHRYFHEMGCRLSDHGIEQPYAEAFSERQLSGFFKKLRRGRCLSHDEALAFKSAVLYELAVMDAEAGWTQQFHFGALRNNSSRMMAALGPDTGFDAIGDFELGRGLVRFLDRLDREGRLARTILYVLHPRDNEMIASIAGSFQDGSVRGKMQFGSAWWFNDQLDGMSRQLEALSNIGLLSTFVGMLTDSRSFLSYPRHEYFRRLLCDIIGADVEAGRLPADLPHLGSIVRDVSWNNAARYFQTEGTAGLK